MRDDYEDDYYAAAAPGHSADGAGWRARYGERISTWSGAVLAVVVIAALAIWIYNLGNRDANAVPVIRAALEPAKVQPDDPGGAEIAHQDITSYTAADPAPDPEGPVILAPPTPRPAADDVAMGTLGGDDDGAGRTTGEEVAALQPQTEAPAPEEPQAEEKPLPGNGTEQAPGYSPVAVARPRDLSQRMEVARKEATQGDDALTAAAAASAVQIQLGAYPDRTQTQAEWKRIFDTNRDILSGRALVVQSTISGGRRFFRMRAGPFRDRTEARNVCRALQARGQDCLVAVNG